MSYRSIRVDSIGEHVNVYGDLDNEFYAAHLVYTDGDETVYATSQDHAHAIAATRRDDLHMRYTEVVTLD